MKVEALSCPFCGKKTVTMLQHEREMAAYSEYRVYCGACEASGPKEKDTRQSQEDAVLAAVKAWNRLALAVQIADAGKRCEEELDGSRKWGNFRQELRRLLEQWEVDDEDDPDA